MQMTQFTDGGLFVPGKIAAILRTTSEELALTVGLGKDALQRRIRIQSDKTQRRLRELVEVLNKVQPRFGSERSLRLVSVRALVWLWRTHGNATCAGR